MELQHVNIKILVDGGSKVDSEKVVSLFHDWVANQALGGLLIDVADYQHVPAGPGILLIGLEGDYSLDHANNQWGLRYNRKKSLEGSNTNRFTQALNAATGVCGRMEEKLGGSLKFDRGSFELFINDRAVASNTKETFEACKADLKAFVDSLGGGEFAPTNLKDARKLFSVTVKPSKPLALS